MNTGSCVLNIEPLVSEAREFGRQRARGDEFGVTQRMRGGECHAAVTGGDERAWKLARLLVNRQAIGRHHAQCAPMHARFVTP